LEDLNDPGPDEITVKVHAIGLNFADIFALQGLYSATPKGLFIPGLEFSGEIVKKGKNISGNEPGTKVMGVTRFGAYTDILNINPVQIVELPQGWTFCDGAAFLVQALTAYYALVFLGNLQKNQIVLIHSAAGGVGLWANRIAKKFGARTIGVVGNREKFNILEKEGFDQSIVRSDSFKQEVLEYLHDERPHLVLECIGGKVFRDSYDLLGRQGRMITYGAAYFSNNRPKPNMVNTFLKYLNRPKVDPLKMMQDNKSVMAFNLIWLVDKVDLFKNLTEGLLNMDLGKPVIGHTFSFEQMLEALKLFQGGKTTGKVVVEL